MPRNSEAKSSQSLLKQLASQGMRSEHFNSRELSWLEFNARVLDEARDPQVPLLERLKFLGIFSSNLDEFFMIRVAGVKHQISAGVDEPGPDGMTPNQAMEAISKRVHELTGIQHKCYKEEIRPLLEAAGVRLLAAGSLDEKQHEYLSVYFQKTLFPVMTPLALDPAHPFPHLANKTLCLVVQLKPLKSSAIPFSSTAFIHIPSSVVPRFIKLPSAPGRHDFILLEDVVRMYIDHLFNGYEIKSCAPIRLTRDSDMLIDEERAADLMTTIEKGLRGRSRGSVVRLQYHSTLPETLLTALVDELDLKECDLYPTNDFIAFADLMQLYSALDLPALKDAPFVAQPAPEFQAADHVFAAIREGDILIHHPYESFDPVVQFVRQAADDPKVLAIKMTLYRVGSTSPIAADLVRAAQNGKQVAVLMELKARFDEEANILWARKLVDAGAHVIYGLVGLKTHCKCALVVRKEGGGIRRYVHLGTGNYNDRTARLYGDIGLFTCDEKFGDDVTNLFNIITGYSRPPTFHHIEIAPTGLRNRLIALIRRECDHVKAGKQGHMILKLNNVQDPILIAELYRASQMGVKIDLIIRTVCCLKPGVPGLSENIRAISIVDRFLEHARICYFNNDGKPDFFLSSADWMQRSLERRIELMFPVLDKALHAHIWAFLQLQLADNTKARLLKPDCTSTRITPAKGEKRIRVQERMIEAAISLATTGQWGDLKVDKDKVDAKAEQTTGTDLPAIAGKPLAS
ncbi:MAG TPA: polyphosphate kinase 1 [Planctomycetota bacterium]|nr:polyphosphate kinase 1 [Planctomycetota bacterium]